MIKYSDYKNFSNEHFKNSLNENLANYTELDYNSFEEIVLNLFSSQASFKRRMARANERVFMNKEIHKTIMVGSRLRNKFLKEKTINFLRKKLHSAEKHIINQKTTALN